jgi:hypothetical protein
LQRSPKNADEILPTDLESGFSFCPNCQSAISRLNMWVSVEGKLFCRSCCAGKGKIEKVQCTNCGKWTVQFLKEPNDKSYYFCYKCHTKFYGVWNPSRMKMKRMIRVEKED